MPMSYKQCIGLALLQSHHHVAGSPQKEKTGDTPTKSKAEVVIAANQLSTNGHKEAIDLDDMESGRGNPLAVNGTSSVGSGINASA